MGEAGVGRCVGRHADRMREPPDVRSQRRRRGARLRDVEPRTGIASRRARGRARVASRLAGRSAAT
ncbi:hypothetical protein DR62_07925 [Burkholderia thailandensis]|nr:hypothetical protein DR62_07925 [Burkholderia thailandensis]AOI55738.1 hypothetical protein WI24_28975 [Burkholderia thailandensis]AOJ54703.1 hypothetical protein AQ475_28765 [Burkholderia thailandensis]AOJ60647.1 hypothetical protein AQ477_30055 [Burkholderia thailandensis]AVR29331.1 hypothetical protein A8H32_32015 [Burkholderia thailandensis]